MTLAHRRKVTQMTNRCPVPGHWTGMARAVLSSPQETSMTSNSSTVDAATRAQRVRQLVVSALLTAVAILAAPLSAQASLMSPELEDAVAGYIAVFVLFFVPVVLIVLFWMVHVLPEKIAHKRHHPQLEAIKTLCLLSLVFGGLLWPIAWLWAYTKPVGYKLAYGTDKHPDYFKEHGLPEPESPGVDLRQRVAQLDGRDITAADLEAIRTDLAVLESRLPPAPGPVSQGVTPTIGLR
jgi:hypothetical protein